MNLQGVRRWGVRLPGWALAIVACFSLGARTSLADETPSLVLDPAPAGDRGAYVERAGVRGDKLVSGRVMVDYAFRPLVLVDSAQNDDVIVRDQTTFHALVSLSLKHRFVLALDVPFSYFRAGAASDPGSGAPRITDGAEFGDVRFGARVRLYQSHESPDEGVTVGIASCFWLPTASEGYGGDGLFRMRGSLVAEGANKRGYWAANGAIRTRPKFALPGILPTRLGTALQFGFSGGFFADGNRAVAIGAEFLGDLTVSGDAQLFDPRATIGHLLLTAHYRIAGGPFEVGGAFGPGLGQGAGSADLRATVMVGVAPEQMEPPRDRDGDGIPDKQDACVSIRGIAWPDPLLNGCPAAAADKDGDAIPDDYDACPSTAGEATFVRQTHGCPKVADTDGDQVPDMYDACPTERGAGPPEGNGCPKSKQPSLVTVTDTRIQISQQVLFETGTAVIRPESDELLRDVARVFVEHPEIKIVQVQGHTDNVGDAEMNRKLSQDRASSVVEWLVRNGVARERLRFQGLGPDVPIAPNDTEEGRAKNRRVDFHIMLRSPVDKSAQPAGSP